MSKLKIVILAVVGIASFGGAFGLTLMLKKTPAEVNAADVKSQQPVSKGIDGTEIEPRISMPSDPAELQRGMSEEKLKSYIDGIREKSQEYKFREKELTELENRIKIAREALQEDIDRLNALNAQLSLVLGDIRQEEEKLQRSRVTVSAEEKANMQRLGATYDTMDVTQSSKVIATMSKNMQMPDAVKILYYMSERNSGKLIGEIASTEPELASVLSLELKKIKESE